MPLICSSAQEAHDDHADGAGGVRGYRVELLLCDGGVRVYRLDDCRRKECEALNCDGLEEEDKTRDQSHRV